MKFFERRPVRSDGPEGECAESLLRHIAATSASIVTVSGSVAGFGGIARRRALAAIRCDLCHYDKFRYPDRVVLKCEVSRPCQKLMADLYPEAYYNEDGTPVAEAVECEGTSCLGVLQCGSDDNGQPELVGGCAIDHNNEEWHANGQHYFERNSGVLPAALAEPDAPSEY